MPGFDGTGPMGQGPMTGRGMGYCGPAQGGTPGRPLGLGMRRGFGGGRGRGRGFRRFAYGGYGPVADETFAALEDRIAQLEAEIDQLRLKNENSDNQR